MNRRELIDTLFKYDSIHTSLKAKESLLRLYLLGDDDEAINELLKKMKKLVKTLEELRNKIFIMVLDNCETNCPDECKVFRFYDVMNDLRKHGTIDNICEYVFCAEGSVIRPDGTVLECRDKKIVEMKEVATYD